MIDSRPSLPEPLHSFLFRKISAKGFGLLRIGWGFTAFFFMLLQWNFITRYYTDGGVLPAEHGHLVYRYAFRFSLLDHITDPQHVFILYLVLLATLLLTGIGKWTRASVIISVILLCSFQERNLLHLAGGDTVLRVLGFLLAITPEVRAFSIDRYCKQKKLSTPLPEPTMSIWPYRLLLWNLIILYVTSAWSKILGTMWIDGTAFAAIIHHPNFAKFPMSVMDALTPLSPLFSRMTLIFEYAWLLLLVPQSTTKKLPLWIPRVPLKRVLILAGILFHGGIFILMEVGSFSIIMCVWYLGLMLEEDFEALRSWFNRKWHGKITVLYDGRCSLCRRSISTVHLLDHLHRVRPVDFRDQRLKQEVASDITEEDLDRAMHIRIPNGKTFKGFDAFRALCWHLPLLWIAAPLLYIPGIAPVGRRIYAKIAANRDQCADGACSHT